ncbi:hypothetical protein H4R34_000033 [Dimargaris verticillata]|uniref:Myb-like domain-containing protein n=1 Tax=Dimargaris verticillata TaxID=2761393 RepID=A0A9W8EFS0_9FUNG|nr:hypothetical protein H4R34_000033 [Dimargaris verticillata]
MDSPSQSPSSTESSPLAMSAQPSPSSTSQSARRVVRDVNWRDAETFHLLRVKREIGDEAQRTRFNTNLWARVAQRMHDAGYQRTSYQCITRWRRLVQRYHELQRTYSDNPQLAMSWAFYREMEEQMDANERRINAPRRSGSTRRRGGSLSAPAKSPISSPHAASAGYATNPAGASGSGMAVRSPPQNRRLLRDTTYPYTLTATPEEGPLAHIAEEGYPHSADEETPSLLAGFRPSRHRGSFSYSQVRQGPLPPISTLQSSLANAAPISSPYGTLARPTASTGLPPPAVTHALPPISTSHHQPGSYSPALHRHSHPASPFPPYRRPPMIPHPPGPADSPQMPDPPTSREASGSAGGPPRLRRRPSHPMALHSEPGTMDKVSHEVLTALVGSLSILRDNQQTMSNVQEQLLQELRNQRDEYNLIRQETRQEFNHYIDELRQERIECHHMLSDNQQRFLQVIQRMCSDITGSVRTAPAPVPVQPPAHAGSSSSESSQPSEMC